MTYGTSVAVDRDGKLLFIYEAEVLRPLFLDDEFQQEDLIGDLAYLENGSESTVFEFVFVIVTVSL